MKFQGQTETRLDKIKTDGSVSRSRITQFNELFRLVSLRSVRGFHRHQLSREFIPLVK